jgi:hypothetical protein
MTKKKLTKKTAQKQIRQAAKAGRIEYAGDERIEALGPLVDEYINRIFGIKSGWFSDLTDMLDFHFDPDKEARRKHLHALSMRSFELYGVTFQPEELLVDVLERIVALRKEQR